MLTVRFIINYLLWYSVQFQIIFNSQSYFRIENSSIIYAADVEGTLTDPEQKVCNLSFDSILKDLDVSHSGVNSSYLYFGMYKTTFSLHIEDMDLYGANYNHFGAPKFWYIVPPKYVNEMEQLCKEKFSKYWDCKGMIRHKNFLISPIVLAERNIPCYRYIQEPGDLMIVFPKTFHCGFNAGFNGCEAHTCPAGFFIPPVLRTWG